MTGNQAEEGAGGGDGSNVNNNDEGANAPSVAPGGDNHNNLSTSTNQQRQRTSGGAPSALHNRLLNQQRSNILLQVLFHHMLNNRRRREEEEALRALQSPPPLPPDREMIVLSREDAIASNAMCRFCFEGADLSNDDNALVAPCLCSGGSRWVHLECLRQWQRLQARNVGGDEAAITTTTMYTTAGYICNVCNSPYLSRPPAVRSVRRNLLKRGTLLISKPNVGRTFQRTVVLLLSDVCGNYSQGAFGLIVNSPLQEELTPNTNNLLTPAAAAAPPPPPQSGFTDQQNGNPNPNPNANTTTNNNNDNPAVMIEWRRGGPVCGGRLGVVHYTVLHTFPPPAPPSSSSDEGGNFLDDVLDVDIDEEYFDDNDEEAVTAGAGAGAANNENENSADEAADTESMDLEAGYSTYDNDNDDDDDQDTDEEQEIQDDDGDDDIEEEEEDDIDNDDDDDDDDDENDDSCAPLSLPVFDVTRNTPPLQFVASPHSSIPTTFSEDSLGYTVQRLVQLQEGRSSSSAAAAVNTTGEGQAAAETETTTTTTTTITNETDNGASEGASTSTDSSAEQPNKVIVFSGYCKWRAGQLEREIQREVWDVCIDATPQDILRHHSSGFWQEISESNRLLSWQRLIEEGEAAAGIEE